MTKKAKENIISIYDQAENKTKAIKYICQMFGLQKDELKEILREFGRDLPYGRKKTKDEPVDVTVNPEDVKEDPPKAADQDRHLPMPQYIVEVLTRELDCLDGQIEAVQQQLDELNQRYTQIAEFLIGTKP